MKNFSLLFGLAVLPFLFFGCSDNSEQTSFDEKNLEKAENTLNENEGMGKLYNNGLPVPDQVSPLGNEDPSRFPPEFVDGMPPQ